MQKSPYQVIEISGEDAADFLQGQLSNDIQLLGESWQYSGLCNPKGRLLCILRIWQHQHSFFALVTTDLAPDVVNRLSMYILRSKVAIEIISDATINFFESAEQLQKFDVELSGQLGDSGNTFASRIDDAGNPVFALGAKHGLLHVCRQSLSPPPEQDDSISRWQQSCITAGIAEITRPVAEAFVPQMVNLDLIGGISFKKGCYTGQEIVARMHYLGNLKQRMLLCFISGDAHSVPLAGQKVFRHQAPEQHAGTLVSISAGGTAALAVLRLAYVDQPLTLENGQSLRVTPDQPYPVPMAG